MTDKKERTNSFLWLFAEVLYEEMYKENQLWPWDKKPQKTKDKWYDRAERIQRKLEER